MTKGLINANCRGEAMVLFPELEPMEIPQTEAGEFMFMFKFMFK